MFRQRGFVSLPMVEGWGPGGGGGGGGGGGRGGKKDLIELQYVRCKYRCWGGGKSPNLECAGGLDGGGE